jgi:hypothetical protein
MPPVGVVGAAVGASAAYAAVVGVAVYAAVGAVIGGVIAGIQGGDIGKGMLYGAIGGAVAGGLSWATVGAQGGGGLLGSTSGGGSLGMTGTKTVEGVYSLQGVGAGGGAQGVGATTSYGPAAAQGVLALGGSMLASQAETKESAEQYKRDLAMGKIQHGYNLETIAASNSGGSSAEYSADRALEGKLAEIEESRRQYEGNREDLLAIQESQKGALVGFKASAPREGTGTSTGVESIDSQVQRHTDSIYKPDPILTEDEEELYANLS